MTFEIYNREKKCIKCGGDYGIHWISPAEVVMKGYGGSSLGELTSDKIEATCKDCNYKELFKPLGC